MYPDGELPGTLCHYSLVTRDPSIVDLELMLQVASKPAQRRLVPPDPVAFTSFTLVRRSRARSDFDPGRADAR